jgi:hypothetical protein
MLLSDELRAPAERGLLGPGFPASASSSSGGDSRGPGSSGAYGFLGDAFGGGRAGGGGGLLAGLLPLAGSVSDYSLIASIDRLVEKLKLLRPRLAAASGGGGGGDEGSEYSAGGAGSTEGGVASGAADPYGVLTGSPALAPLAAPHTASAAAALQGGARSGSGAVSHSTPGPAAPPGHCAEGEPEGSLRQHPGASQRPLAAMRLPPAAAAADAAGTAGGAAGHGARRSGRSLSGGGVGMTGGAPSLPLHMSAAAASTALSAVAGHKRRAPSPAEVRAEGGTLPRTEAAAELSAAASGSRQDGDDGAAAIGPSAAKRPRPAEEGQPPSSASSDSAGAINHSSSIGSSASTIPSTSVAVASAPAGSSAAAPPLSAPATGGGLDLAADTMGRAAGPEPVVSRHGCGDGAGIAPDVDQL